MLTFDLDFGEILAAAGTRFPSVVILRLRNARADHVVDRLSTLLQRAGDALQQGAIAVVEEAQLRIRELPIRGES